MNYFPVPIAMQAGALLIMISLPCMAASGLLFLFGKKRAANYLIIAAGCTFLLGLGLLGLTAAVAGWGAFDA